MDTCKFSTGQCEKSSKSGFSTLVNFSNDQREKSPKSSFWILKSFFQMLYTRKNLKFYAFDKELYSEFFLVLSSRFSYFLVKSNFNFLMVSWINQLKFKVFFVIKTFNANKSWSRSTTFLEARVSGVLTEVSLLVKC